MILYAETSAVLSWLLGEPRAVGVARFLESALLVLTSELTDIECARVLHRGRALGVITPAQARILLDEYTMAASQWDRLTIGDRVALVASGPYPAEPIRALDAIHLASALVAREAFANLVVLSLDERIRANAVSLGLSVEPN